MKRNPLYVFENINSIGINTVPLKSMVQINDMDGAGHPVTVQLINKTGLSQGTTIGQFLALPTLYNISGDAIFLRDDQVGVPGGIAALDAQGKVPGINIPTLEGTEVFVANSEVEMVATLSKEGDTCVRLDLNKSFIKLDDSIGTIGSWVELAAVGAGTVSSVNSKAGNITLVTSDISEDVNLYYTDVRADNRILNAIDDNSGAGSLDQLWSSDKIDREIQALTFDDTVIDGRIQTIESDYARLIQNNDFLGMATFQQDVSVTGNVLSHGNITSSGTLTTGLDSNSNSKLTFNYGHATKGPVSIYVDNTDDTLKIDDSTGTGYTLFHSGIIDPALKINTTDGESLGKLRVNQGGYQNTAEINISGTQGQDTDVMGVYQSSALYFADNVGNSKYAMEIDNTNTLINFKVNEITSMTLAKNKSPMSLHSPVDPEDLTRKDYVDTMVPLSGGIMTGNLTLSDSKRILMENTVDGNSFIMGQGKDGGVQGDWYLGRGTGTTDLVSLKNRLGAKTSSVGLDTNGEVVVTKTLTVNNDEVGGSKNTLILRSSDTSVGNTAGIVFVDGLIPKWGMHKDTDNNFVFGYVDNTLQEVQTLKMFNDGRGVQFDVVPTTLAPAINPEDIVRKDYVDSEINKVIKVQDPLPGEPWQDGDILIYDQTLGMFVAKPYITTYGGTSSRPQNAVEGTFYFDSNINRPIWWTGGSLGWIDATGAQV